MNEKKAYEYTADDWLRETGMDIAASNVLRIRSIQSLKYVRVPSTKKLLPHSPFESLRISQESDIESFVYNVLDKLEPPLQILLIPYGNEGERGFYTNIHTKKDVFDALEDKLYINYRAFISEIVSDIKYNGNAISDGKGNIVIEIAEGPHRNIVSGYTTPTRIEVEDYEITRPSKYIPKWEVKKIMEYVEFIKAAFGFRKCTARNEDGMLKESIYFFEIFRDEIFQDIFRKHSISNPSINAPRF